MLTAAALLHLAAGAVGPWSHVPDLGVAAMAASVPSMPDEQQDTPQHSDERCVLCHSMVSAALPATPAELPSTVCSAEAVRPRGAPRRDRGVGIAARARGPPLA